jgi:DNA-directed RNA polymerase specialized sigma24 family protein
MGVEGEIESKVNAAGRGGSLRSVLDRLARERDVAVAYEQLRMRLVTFFRLSCPVEAEALADEAIDRLGRRLLDGTPVDNLAGYALGIARFLVMEAGARRRKEQDAAREALMNQEGHAFLEPSEFDPAVPALRGCLSCIDPESARFIMEYYVADGGAARIERRRQLAERMGMTLNALRNRALRTRIALEKCVRARLLAGPGLGAGADEGSTDCSDVPGKTHTKDIMQYHACDRCQDDVRE